MAEINKKGLAGIGSVVAAKKVVFQGDASFKTGEKVSEVGLAKVGADDTLEIYTADNIDGIRDQISDSLDEKESITNHNSDLTELRGEITAGFNTKADKDEVLWQEAIVGSDEVVRLKTSKRIDAGAYRIQSLAIPVNDNDATTKSYVDRLFTASNLINLFEAGDGIEITLSEDETQIKIGVT